MKTITQNDLQEIKELIKSQNQKIDQLEQKVEQKIDQLEQKVTEKIDKLAEKVDNVEKSQIRLEGKIEAWKSSIDKIPDLAEKVGELKNWRSIALVVISGVITTLFWFFRNGKL
jgi:predicted nuclease with TOPRIM domain